MKDNYAINPKIRFIGELEHISPKLLITEKEYNRVESFFLGLGVVFNDLKGIILFEKMLIDYYEKPQDNEITSHAGNYGGVYIQIQKLIASTINEFFAFLRKNSDLLNTNEFKEIFKKLNKEERVLWEGMIAASRNKFSRVTDFMKTIAQIRSNVAFHYDHSGKILRSAYISYFFGKTHDGRNKHAYYSIGDSIENTRFYFSDAAVEESLYIAAGKKLKESHVGNTSLEKYRQQTRETIEVMSAVISSILKKYIKLRRNLPH